MRDRAVRAASISQILPSHIQFEIFSFRMAIFGLSSRTVALIGLGLFLAFYLDESPLTISTDLSNWITKGSYMNYKGYKIFYRGESCDLIVISWRNKIWCIKLF